MDDGRKITAASYAGLVVVCALTPRDTASAVNASAAPTINGALSLRENKSPAAVGPIILPKEAAD
jgi:hypothetical protein